MAVPVSNLFFINNLGIVRARIFPDFRLLVYLTLENVFKDKTNLEPDPCKASHEALLWKIFTEKIRNKSFFEEKVYKGEVDAIVSLYYLQINGWIDSSSCLFSFLLRQKQLLFLKWCCFLNMLTYNVNFCCTAEWFSYTYTFILF